MAALIAGLLLNIAQTLFDLHHFDELFHAGDSTTGGLAALAEQGFSRVRLIAAVATITLLVTGTWRVRVGSLPWLTALAALCVAIVCCCGGWLHQMPPNDGADPHILGVVHDARVPTWIHFADTAAPIMVISAAIASVVLLLLPTTTRQVFHAAAVRWPDRPLDGHRS